MGDCWRIFSCSILYKTFFLLFDAAVTMSFSIYDALMELSSDDYLHNNALSPIPASQQPTPETNNNNIMLLDLDAQNQGM